MPFRLPPKPVVATRSATHSQEASRLDDIIAAHCAALRSSVSPSDSLASGDIGTSPIAHSSCSLPSESSAMPNKDQSFGQRMLTRQQAAQLLGVSPATLSRWATERTGPVFVKYGTSRSNSVRYPLDALKEFIASRLPPQEK